MVLAGGHAIGVTFLGMVTYRGPRRLAMADEFVTLEDDTYIEKQLPGGATTRVLVGRAGTRVHKSRLEEGQVLGQAAAGHVPEAPETEEAEEAEGEAAEGGEDAASEAEATGEGEGPEATGDAEQASTEGQQGTLEGEGQEPGPEQPAGNAPTDEWAAYAVRVGIPADEVAEMGREDIKERLARGV